MLTPSFCTFLRTAPLVRRATPTLTCTAPQPHRSRDNNTIARRHAVRGVGGGVGVHRVREQPHAQLRLPRRTRGSTRGARPSGGAARRRAEALSLWRVPRVAGAAVGAAAGRAAAAATSVRGDSDAFGFVVGEEGQPRGVGVPPRGRGARGRGARGNRGGKGGAAGRRWTGGDEQGGEREEVADGGRRSGNFAVGPVSAGRPPGEWDPHGKTRPRVTVRPPSPGLRREESVPLPRRRRAQSTGPGR